jgi:hypothetical protein
MVPRDAGMTVVLRHSNGSGRAGPTWVEALMMTDGMTAIPASSRSGSTQQLRKQCGDDRGVLPIATEKTGAA